MNLNINAIYMATEGEGVHIGTAQIFVRFQGCAVGCINCDSKETWDFIDLSQSLDSVVAKVESLSLERMNPIKRVSITGGDPLHPKNEKGVLALVQELRSRGFYINIEAAGTRVVDSIFNLVDFISFDFKTPSTNVTTNIKVLKQFVQNYGEKAQIKSVISDKKDFECTFNAYKEIEVHLAHTPWVLTPCFEPGEMFSGKRFALIMDMNHTYGAPFRVVGQQHKWVYGADAKNV